MPFSIGLDKISPPTRDEQEDEKETDSNESGKSFMDFMDTKTELKENELELPGFYDRNVKNFSTVEDAAYWEEEVKDMMKSVKKVHETLSDGGKFEEVFRFCKEECGDQKEIKSELDLKLFIEEIEKMDSILKAKVNEEKKAKLSRIQTEEESRSILTSVPFTNTSSGMKVNLEEFIKLLNEVDSVENDSSVSSKVGETNDGGDLKEEDKKEKATGQHQKINNLKFIERNIQLAKCGRGTLSLTDEEKSRIESLLADLEHSSAKRVEGSEEKTVYGIDDKTKSILSQIDERLEMMAEVRRPISGRVSKIFEGSEKGKREEKEERNRLKKINQLLNSVNSISCEEILPLTDEELESLIRESKEMFTEESGSEEVQCPGITELVSSAKLLMPKFKYRFDEC